MQLSSSLQNQKNTQIMQDLLARTSKLSEAHVSYEDQLVKNIQYQINQAIREIFGPESIEFNTHKHHNWLCNYKMKDDDSVKQKKFSEGIPKMSGMLSELISTLQKKHNSDDSFPFGNT